MADVERALERAKDPADPDDTAAMHARVAEVLSSLGEHERAMEQKQLSIEFKERHNKGQAYLLKHLQLALVQFDKPPT